MAQYVVSCDSAWIDTGSGFTCPTVASIVDAADFALPSLTYTDANTIIAAVIASWALAYVFRYLIKMMR